MKNRNDGAGALGSYTGCASNEGQGPRTGDELKKNFRREVVDVEARPRGRKFPVEEPWSRTWRAAAEAVNVWGYMIAAVHRGHWENARHWAKNARARSAFACELLKRYPDGNR